MIVIKWLTQLNGAYKTTKLLYKLLIELLSTNVVKASDCKFDDTKKNIIDQINYTINIYIFMQLLINAISLEYYSVDS